MRRRKLTPDEIFKDRPSIEKLKSSKRTPVVAVIENIRSMHNVGSIFRSSDGMRLEKLYLTGFTPVPPRPEINKTALGSTESVPFEYHKNTMPLLIALKKQGYSIVVVEQTDDSKSFFDVDYSFPLCIIFGNEVDGISEEVTQIADMAVEIPMQGIKHSLNVSVAFGIISYHILSKYQ